METTDLERLLVEAINLDLKNNLDLEIIWI